MQAIPYRITPDVIRSVVEKHRIGAYVLGDEVDGHFVFKYVGRSDHCLQTRLLTHRLLYRCSYFIFLYTRTDPEAFELESKWWHDCKNADIALLNSIHPDTPSGKHLLCPYCQFSRDAKEYFPLSMAS